MAWFYLLLAGLFEIGWPLGLKYGWSSDGIRPLPLSVAAVCMVISGALLMLAQRDIPMGTAYAVWTGIGAVGAFLVGIALFKEPATAMRFVCIGLIATGIVGLKLASR